MSRKDNLRHQTLEAHPHDGDHGKSHDDDDVDDIGWSPAVREQADFKLVEMTGAAETVRMATGMKTVTVAIRSSSALRRS
jgi:hypothetical protein